MQTLKEWKAANPAKVSEYNRGYKRRADALRLAIRAAATTQETQ